MQENTSLEDVKDDMAMPKSSGGYFPTEYFIDFVKFLDRNRDKVEVITYKDLLWQEQDNPEKLYPAERSAWHKKYASPSRSWLPWKKKKADKAYVLLQHDVDSQPHRTMRIVKAQMEYNIPSNVMIFNKRVNRRKLKNTGQVEVTEYPLDDTLLQQAEKQGFVIGYHMNANELAGFSEDKARELFVRDIADLRSRFNIEFYSAHGGIPGPDGKNNRDLDIAQKHYKDLKWVHNRVSPAFAANYSDGGINNPNRDPEARDLRNFVKTWEPGKRYRILTHPQYFSNEWGEAKMLLRSSWYKKMLDQYSSGRGEEFWEDDSLISF